MACQWLVNGLCTSPGTTLREPCGNPRCRCLGGAGDLPREALGAEDVAAAARPLRLLVPHLHAVGARLGVGLLAVGAAEDLPWCDEDSRYDTQPVFDRGQYIGWQTPKVAAALDKDREGLGPTVPARAARVPPGALRQRPRSPLLGGPWAPTSTFVGPLPVPFLLYGQQSALHL